MADDNSSRRMVIVSLSSRVHLNPLNLFQGQVAFSQDTGDRIALTQIEQLQHGKYEVVAFYDQKVSDSKLQCKCSHKLVGFISYRGIVEIVKMSSFVYCFFIHDFSLFELDFKHLGSSLLCLWSKVLQCSLKFCFTNNCFVHYIQI